MFDFFVSARNATDLRVIEAAKSIAHLSDSQLQSEAKRVKEILVSNQNRPASNEAIASILSIGVAAIYRSFGFYLHRVQIQAVIAAAHGKTIEMQTGEGKTIVSGLIGYFFSHFGHVHLATTNPYLAQRDFEYVRPFYDMLGVSSGLVTQQQAPSQKRRAYLADVTFGPGYQFGFDYLMDQTTLRNYDRDRIGMSTLLRFTDQNPDDFLVQQGGHHTMIIDEADSIMIDEALTPLVLSGVSVKPHDPRPYHYAHSVMKQLVQDSDFVYDSVARKIGLTKAGFQKIHLNQSALADFELTQPFSAYIENALRAEYLFALNEHYVIQQDKVKIVDQFTGRIFDDRQWQAGLHQAVCVKENVSVELPNEIQAHVSRQRYFRLYDRRIGLSGTLKSVRNELRQVYRCKVAIIPTHQPSKRRYLPTRFFESVDSKLEALAIDVESRHLNGQPILLGTRTIKQSEACAECLQERGLKPTLLNGLQNEEEAEIVSRAGIAGNITIATNMAGRGTDIKLDEQAAANGGLHVIGFEHNFSRRVDRQLVGRSARQGQPGSSQFFQSCDDELLCKTPSLAKKLRRTANRNGEITNDRAVQFVLGLQQTQEKKARAARRSLMNSDGWLNQVRKTLVEEDTP